MNNHPLEELLRAARRAEVRLEVPQPPEEPSAFATRAIARHCGRQHLLDKLYFSRRCAVSALAVTIIAASVKIGIGHHASSPASNPAAPWMDMEMIDADRMFEPWDSSQ